MCARSEAMREVRSAAWRLSHACLTELLRVDTTDRLPAPPQDFAELLSELDRRTSRR